MIRITLSFLFVLTVLSITPTKVYSLSSGSYGQKEEISMMRGELKKINGSNLERVSIADPGIVDVVDVKEDEILLIAKDIGVTAVFIWDDVGKRTVMVHVSAQDLKQIKKRITQLLYLADITMVDITVNKEEGRVILSGVVAADKQNVLDEVLAGFSDDVINLVQEEQNEDLIQVDMRITELNTSLTKSLGVDWITGTSEVEAGDDGIITTTFAGTPFQPTYLERFPTDLDGSAKDLFKLGSFRRSLASNMVARINALIEEGKGKILSEPKLVVKGGEEASFLVGGEIPIKSTTSVEGSTQEDTTYKAYGIGMTITPVIKNDTQVDIILNVEISDVDASNSTGTDVAFVTRTASTHLILEDGETNILAGLIRSQESERVRRIPFFSKIPIVGAAFRSKRNPAANTDQELIISLTPKILAYSKRKQKKMAAKNKKKAEQMMPNTKHGYRSAKPHYSGVANVMHEYIAQVQRKISQEANYPQEAIVYGLEGTVKLDLLILGDGTLAFALVKESSGHTIIDEYAVEAAKNMAPYDAFPSGSGLRELSVTIPLVYNLNSY